MVRGAVPIDEQNAEGEDMPVNGIPRLPSHVRRARGGGHEGDGSTISRNVRGVLKGYKAAKKRLATNTDKLPIQFSTRLGGAIGVNRRSFVDEIVLQMRQHSPLVGVETWSKVPKKKKELIVQKVLSQNFEDDDVGDILNLCREDIARVSVNADVVERIIQEQDADEPSNDDESDSDSDGLVYSDDDSIQD